MQCAIITVQYRCILTQKYRWSKSVAQKAPTILIINYSACVYIVVTEFSRERMSIYVTAVHITAYFIANLLSYYAYVTKDRGTITGQRNFSRGYVIFTSIFFEHKASSIRI